MALEANSVEVAFPFSWAAVGDCHGRADISGGEASFVSGCSEIGYINQWVFTFWVIIKLFTIDAIQYGFYNHTPPFSLPFLRRALEI